MARGKSGRIVLEVDPELKRGLYLELEKKQKTLKEWFVSEATEIVYTAGMQKGKQDAKEPNKTSVKK